MIDLAKPLGIHQNIIFYGDHENPDLVYYFPDEVDLAQRMDKDGKSLELFELFFQLFHEGNVTEGGIEALQKTAGSILQLGVQCKVSEKRLEKALQSLKNTNLLSDNLKFTVPPWKDGAVHFMALDATSLNPDSVNENSFVKSIIGTNKPSLMSSDLKSIFNVRFDRRGTALINSALEGDAGSIAGVFYDLQYTALRPAVDLKIWADLKNCYTTALRKLEAKAGFDVYNVNVSIGAQLEELTKAMESNGDIKFELISQVEDNETKKQIDEMVKDFKGLIIKELFNPMVVPSESSKSSDGNDLTDLVSNIAYHLVKTPKIGLSYFFRKEKIEQSRIIEVDYSERSTTVRNHTPQSHLWLFGKKIADKKSLYITKTVFNDIWREQELKIDLINDFSSENNDLLSAEVMVWRKQYGLGKNVQSGRFAIPAQAETLKNITFYKNHNAPVKFSWFNNAGEEIGYYYQIRFLYTGNVKNVSSPKEILTEPMHSNCQNLIIFPNTYVFYKQIFISAGNIDFADISSVDVTLFLKNDIGKLIDNKTVTLTSKNHREVWAIRGEDKNHLFVETTKTYHFVDGRPSIKTQPVYLIDDNLIVNRPLNKSSITLYPVVAGKNERVEQIWLNIILNSPLLEKPVSKSYSFIGPDFNIPPIEVKLNSEDDIISYQAKAFVDGAIIDIDSGQIPSDYFVIDLKKVSQKKVVFTWEGKSPEAMDLKYLRVELQSKESPNATPVALPSIEYKGALQPSPVTQTFDSSSIIEMRIVKKYNSGKTEQGKFQMITEPNVVIR